MGVVCWWRHCRQLTEAVSGSGVLRHCPSAYRGCIRERSPQTLPVSLQRLYQGAESSDTARQLTEAVSGSGVLRHCQSACRGCIRERSPQTLPVSLQRLYQGPVSSDTARQLAEAVSGTGLLRHCPSACRGCIRERCPQTLPVSLQFVCLFVGCLTSQQHASVSQGRICSDKFTFCHTEIEVADQTFYLTQSQYTDTWPTSPSADPITPGAWQGSHWRVNF